MFQLTIQEYENLRFQIGTSKRGGRRYLPYAFTDRVDKHGSEIRGIFEAIRKMVEPEEKPTKRIGFIAE